MASRFRRLAHCQEFNIWIAFTDLISNAFLILSLILLLIFLMDQSQIQSLRTQIIAKTPESAPPFIVITTTGGYQFDTGSAELPEALNDYVKGDLIHEIRKNYDSYKIDLVEVIGHTDSRPILGQLSNLDSTLENVLGGTIAQKSLIAGSNTDLGLMRAMSVVSILRSEQKTRPWMKNLQMRPYSAGQMILRDGSLSEKATNKDESDRRRIEIRFTRLGKEQRVSAQ